MAGTPAAGQVDLARLRDAAREPENWLDPAGDIGETYYSRLTQIDVDDVARLGFAWHYETGSPRGRVAFGLEATPVVVDGVMYSSGPWGAVYALDARTGRELWRFDPDVDASTLRGSWGAANRGLQVWKGRVYVATFDGNLVALDAESGRTLWKVDTIIDHSRPYTIGGAPQIAKDVVVIGNSGGESGVRGYFGAYDLENGALRWRFFTVPGDPTKGYEHPELEVAARTWDPNSLWEAGGGGTVWGHMAYDPELDLLYVGTGNAGPYPRTVRSPSGGDNLFLASILAIDPDDGRLTWYYQEVPGESWDYTATQHMILADLELRGRSRKVLMQAPKNGFFYVLDRATGELLSAEKIVTVNWASHVDLATGRPDLTGRADYSDGPRLVAPGTGGGHNWQPMSYSPRTGLVYLGVVESPHLFMRRPGYRYRRGWRNMATDVMVAPFPPPFERFNADLPRGLGESLVAWDPVRQREVWRVRLPGMLNGGVLSTAGDVVFQGTSSGHLIAYHAATGEVLKDLEVGTGILAAPMSYAIDGDQYVAVMAGYGGALAPFYPPGTAPYRYQNLERILTFRLDGGAVPLPPPAASIEDVPEPPIFTAPPGAVEQGRELFGEYCAPCHGGRGSLRSGYPDLHRMSPGTYAIFEEIVLGGRLATSGMASFADLLTPDDVEAIRAFLVDDQRKLRHQPQSQPRRPPALAPGG